MTAVDDNTAMDAMWSQTKPDERGLVSAIIQHAHTHQVLMLGFMNRAAFAATWTERRVTFWSRSRQRLWEKGEDSGNTLDLVDIRVDCDGDALLVQAIPRGPTCHTGTTSCFFRSSSASAASLLADDGPPPAPGSIFERLFAVIVSRKGATAEKSYVRALLTKGPEAVVKKIEEEAGELGQAIAGETDERVASEAADLLFHAFVGLAARDLDLTAVTRVLEGRFGTSGLAEKASRGQRRE